MKLISCFIIYILCFSGLCQNYDSVKSIESLEIEKKSKLWLEDLYNQAVEIKGDSMIFNNEAHRILDDIHYFNLIYPKTYSWRKTQYFLKKNHLKLSVWYMINLFYYGDEKNKETVLKMIIPLDQILEMDKIMISTFYSYISFDPEIAVIKDGKIEKVIRPDIAEQKLIATEEIVNQILQNRAQNKN